MYRVPLSPNAAFNMQSFENFANRCTKGDVYEMWICGIDRSYSQRRREALSAEMQCADKSSFIEFRPYNASKFTLRNMR